MRSSPPFPVAYVLLKERDMGDHRASIQITMSFHGVTDSTDMWINYCPEGEYRDVDDRIIEFIRSIYDRGMAAYDKEMERYHAKEKEDEERAELKRLQDKYGKT